jgi:hypothetical protein
VSYLDVFFATIDLHQEMAERRREVSFAGRRIPILAPEHLVICKAIFDRPKDWVDIEAMVDWGTSIEADEVLTWVERILGPDSEQGRHLEEILGR